MMQERFQKVFGFWPAIAVVLATMVVAILSSAAHAQPDIREITYTNHKQDRFAVEKLLKDGVIIPAGDQEKFDLYFIEYVLPPIAKIGDEKSRHDLPAVRAEIKKYFRLASGPPYEQLNRIVREFMKVVIRKVNDPECRVNAALVLGDLNEEFEGDGGKLLRPLPAALNDLIGYLKMPKLPDYMRAAAMVGVQRHASYPMEPGVEAALTQLMLRMLSEKQVPPSRSPGSHAYMRRSAAEVLGVLGNVGEKGEVVAAVVNALDEKDTPLSFRLGLCGVVGMFKYPTAAKLDYKKIGTGVGAVLVLAAEQEIARAEKLSEQQQELVDPDRRRLSYYFKQADLALAGANRRNGRNGLAAAAAGMPIAASLQNVSGQVSKTLIQLDKEDEFVDSEQLEETLAAIKEALSSNPEEGKLPVELSGAKKVAKGTKKTDTAPSK